MGARSQPESNENPTTAYEKRDDFSIFSRAVPEAFGDAMFFSVYNCKEDTHPLEKK